MKHVKNIKVFMKLLLQSEQTHALIVQSPPGWAKSTTINEVLTGMGIQYVSLGSYSTPLFFYNALVQHPDKVLVLDDCAGLFDDVNAMSLLKAATWPVDGNATRVVTWGSTAKSVAAPAVDFKGKLILLSNTIPNGRETEAFVSRCLTYKIEFTRANIAKMLSEASVQRRYFPNQKRAKQVYQYLIENLERRDYTQFNLRTFARAYELAAVTPKTWKETFELLLPRLNPKQMVIDLSRTDDDVEEQWRTFNRITQLSRSTFFRYRVAAGLDGTVPVGRKSKASARESLATG